MCPHINKVDQRMPVKNNKGLVIKIRCPLFARKIRRNIVLLIQISIPEKVSFVTNGSWEKDTENGALDNFFGPSYFETALVLTTTFFTWNTLFLTVHTYVLVARNIRGGSAVQSSGYGMAQSIQENKVGFIFENRTIYQVRSKALVLLHWTFPDPFWYEVKSIKYHFSIIKSCFWKLFDKWSPILNCSVPSKLYPKYVL